MSDNPTKACNIKGFAVPVNPRNGPELPPKDCEAKRLDMFNRRARTGQCFHRRMILQSLYALYDRLSKDPDR